MYIFVIVSPTDSPKSTHKHSPSEPQLQQKTIETITLSTSGKQTCICAAPVGSGVGGGGGARSKLTKSSSAIEEVPSSVEEKLGHFCSPTGPCQCTGNVDIRCLFLFFFLENIKGLIQFFDFTAHSQTN